MIISALKSIFLKSNKTGESVEQTALRLIKSKRPLEAKELIINHVNEFDATAEFLALLGESEFHLNNFQEAEHLFYKSLRKQPGLPNAHYGLSLLNYHAGRYLDALEHATYARNLKPNEARYLAQLGLCLISQRSYSQARDVLRQATLLDPYNAPALNNLGIALHAVGEISESLYYFHCALEVEPNYQPAKKNLLLFSENISVSLKFDPESGLIEPHLTESDTNFTELIDNAIHNLESEFSRQPNDPRVANHLVKGYIKTLRMEEARDVIHIALAHHPNDLGLLITAGQLAHLLGQFTNARNSYEKVLSQSPNELNALLGLTQVLRDMGNVSDAIVPARKAANISQTPQTLLQLAFSQANACCYSEALDTCDLIESMAPNMSVHLLPTRAVSHAYLGQFDKAYSLISQAQRNNVSMAAAFNVFRGLLDLLQENYESGWEGYRQRGLTDPDLYRPLPYAKWQGEPLTGKIILVLAEQGLGDQVMFASCLEDLLLLNPKQILLEANNRVAKTLNRSFPDIEVFASGQQSFDWLPKDSVPDYYIAISELPYFFRRHIHDFPSKTAYLIPNLDRAKYWRNRIGPATMNVGISWRGGLQKTRQILRSLDLDSLLPILSTPGVCFVNLQYGDVQSTLVDFSAKYGINIINFPEAITDLDEFASIISALDLVITVCNTTVHFTGAQNKPCWVMAPHVPEWRYGLSSSNMRWYPSTRMFRQPAPGDWESVIAEVRANLIGYKPQPHDQA